MNQRAIVHDSAHGKRIAREVSPWTAIMALVLGLRSHEPWWFIVGAVLLTGVATYWFWRACDYLAFLIMRGSRSKDRDAAA